MRGEGKSTTSANIAYTIAQSGKRVLPVALIDHIVPFGDQIVQGTAGKHSAQLYAALTEGHAAIHTPCALSAPLLSIEHGMKFIKASDPLQRFNGRILPVFIF